MRAFEYVAPRTESEVLEFLAADFGDTAILAGGTDLVGLMKKMIVTPARVVNIMEVPSLGTIEVLPDGSLCIGATVTLDRLLDHRGLDVYPAVRQAVQGINSMQLQCQGTLGGELMQRPGCWYYRNGMGLLSDAIARGANRYHAILGNSGPAKFVNGSRLAPALLALGASVRIVGPRPADQNVMDLAALYRTPTQEGERETVSGPGQLLSHVILPPISGQTCATYEVRHGAGPEAPLAAASAALQFTRGGVVAAARIVMGQVAPVPWISQEAAEVITGHRISEELAAAAGRAAVAMATPLSENEYKVQLASVAVKRSILLAAGHESGGFSHSLSGVEAG